MNFEAINNTFGVELEIVGINQYEAEQALNDAGIEAHQEGYNHVTKTWWKVVYDGSLSCTRTHKTAEVVSPILKGAEGLAQLKTVCEALEGAGATVNKTCGIHVHVGAKHLKNEQIKAIYTRYSKHQHAINKFFPASRTDGQYCRSIASGTSSFYNDGDSRFGYYGAGELTSAKTIAQMTRAIGTRYTNVNLFAYLTHTTVEFRQHAGSVDFAKISNWVKFCVEFVENTAKMAKTTRGIKKIAQDFLAGATGTDAELTFKLAENLASQGLVCKENHIKWCVKNLKTAADTLFAGIEADVVAFLEARTAHFSR